MKIKYSHDSIPHYNAKHLSHNYETRHIILSYTICLEFKWRGKVS